MRRVFRQRRAGEVHMRADVARMSSAPSSLCSPRPSTCAFAAVAQLRQRHGIGDADTAATFRELAG